MAEAAATVAGLISLGLTVCEGLIKYFHAAAGCHRELKDTLSRLNSLSIILVKLSSLLEKSGLPSSQVGLQSILNCQAGIIELEEKQKQITGPGTSVAFLRRAAYPFRKHQLESLKATLDVLQFNVNSVCNLIQLEQTQILLTRQRWQTTRASVASTRRKPSKSNAFCGCRGLSTTINQWTGYLTGLFYIQHSRHDRSCPQFEDASVKTEWRLRLVVPFHILNGRYSRALDVAIGNEYQLSVGLVGSRLVPDDSPAFRLLDIWQHDHWRSSTSLDTAGQLAKSRKDIALMMQQNELYPKDICFEGSGLLHLVLYIATHYTGDNNQRMFQEALALIQDLIDFGVSVEEKNTFGQLPLDYILTRCHVPRSSFRRCQDTDFRLQLLRIVTKHHDLPQEQSSFGMLWNLDILQSCPSYAEEFTDSALEKAALCQSLPALKQALETIPLNSCPLWLPYSAAAIACAEDWQEGLSMLIDAGLDICQDNFNSWCKCPLQTTLEHGSYKCAEKLLTEPCVIHRPTQSLQYALLGDSLHLALEHGKSVVEIFVSELALRRREIARMALEQQMNGRMILLEDLDDEKVLDISLPETIESLERHGLRVPEQLKHEFYGSIYACAGTERFTASAADILFSHGFRDFPENWTGDGGLFLMRVVWANNLQTRFQYVAQQLEVFAWLNAKGAFVGGEANQEMMLIFATRMGNMLGRRCSESTQPCDTVIYVSNAALRSLKDMFLATDTEDCSCSCSGYGCTGLHKFVRACSSVMQATEDTSKVIPDLSTTVQHIAGVLMPLFARMPELRAQMEGRAIRALLFERLSMRHTCRIHDERAIKKSFFPEMTPAHEVFDENDSVDQESQKGKAFKLIVPELLYDWHRSGKTLATWLETSFESRITHVLQDDAPSTEA